MDYQKIISIIEKKRRFGSLPGIAISRKLLAAVGNPENSLAFVHIAGTNGKGSTAAFLSAILQEASIKTGLFTSPHLIDFTERIQADGRPIPKNDVVRLGEQLLGMPLEPSPTMFDLCFVMALLYFKEQKCELAVLETGLGGRLDATNAIEAPLVSIITKIGHDHTEVLGDSLSEIAAEKAGILKKGTRAVLESQKPEAAAVLTECCSRLGIPYQIINPEEIIPMQAGFSYQDPVPYQIKMAGTFQRENAAAAILAAKELSGLSYPIDSDAIHRGIAKAFWMGRMEIACCSPFLLLDGAHNENGVQALCESLRELYPGEKFHFIMGVLSDKDYRKMAECILPLAVKVTAVTPDCARALQEKELAEYIISRGVRAEYGKTAEEAFAPFSLGDAKAATGRTVAFGSLYFIGEAKKILGAG